MGVFNKGKAVFNALATIQDSAEELEAEASRIDDKIAKLEARRTLVRTSITKLRTAESALYPKKET